MGVMCELKAGYQRFFGETCDQCSEYGVICDNVGFLGGVLLGWFTVDQHPSGLIGLRFTDADERKACYIMLANGLRIGIDGSIQNCPARNGEMPHQEVAKGIWTDISDLTKSNFPMDIKRKLNL